MTTAGIIDIPGVVESRLGAADAAALPDHTPVAPWTTWTRAVLWWHRASPVAREMAPRRAIPLTLAAVVDYLESPVGSYREVFASPGLLRGGAPAVSVPFIAVDSLASVHGGRAHWRLPKTVASFDMLWQGRTVSAGVTGAGDGSSPWSLTIEAAGRGPLLPLAGVLPLAQPGPDGDLQRSLVQLRGRGRWARVTTTAAGPTLPTWLRDGPHRGVVIESGRLTISRPR